MSAGFSPRFSKLGLDLTDGTPYTINLHVFLRPWVGSMNLIKSKNPGVNESKIAHSMRRGGGGGGGGGGLPPPLSIPPPPYI